MHSTKKFWFYCYPDSPESETVMFLISPCSIAKETIKLLKDNNLRIHYNCITKNRNKVREVILAAGYKEEYIPFGP